MNESTNLTLKIWHNRGVTNVVLLLYNCDASTGKTFEVSCKNFTRISQLDGRKGSRAETNMVRNDSFYSGAVTQT